MYKQSCSDGRRKIKNKIYEKELQYIHRQAYTGKHYEEDFSTAAGTGHGCWTGCLWRQDRS
jgi:hypothetical protein